MNNERFPSNYNEWRNCIEVREKIPLTSAYIESRLAELSDANHAKTKEFAQLYGADHLQQTIEWFRRAAEELPNG